MELEAAKKKINLSTLQRYDPEIVVILLTIPHIVLYAYESNQWVRDINSRPNEKLKAVYSCIGVQQPPNTVFVS